MSNNLRETIEMAKNIEEFVNKIKEYKFTMDDIKDVSFFRPSITETIKIISDWIEGKNVHIETTEIIDELEPSPAEEAVGSIKEAPETVSLSDIAEKINTDIEEVTAPIEAETNNIVADIMSKQKQMDNNDINMIAYFICTQCKGMSVKETRKACYAEFPDFKQTNLMRLVKKQTFTEVTDRYYTIDTHGNIKACENHPVSKIDGTVPILIDKMKDPVKFKLCIGTMPDEIWRPILVDLCEKGCLVSRIFYDRKDTITKEDLINMETVKRAVHHSGLLSAELDPFDMAVLISHAIMKVGKRKTARITNYVKKTWNVTITHPEQVFGIINKKDFAEVSDKFFK